MMREPVMHYEGTPGRSLCGRDLPTAGFFTDDPATFEDRAGSRCKSCWRVYQRDLSEEMRTNLEPTAGGNS